MRPDEHRADQTEAQRDDDRVGRDRERADDAVEGERRVQHLEVEEQEEPGLAGGLGQRRRAALARGHAVVAGGRRPRAPRARRPRPRRSRGLEQRAETVDGEVGDQPRTPESSTVTGPRRPARSRWPGRSSVSGDEDGQGVELAALASGRSSQPSHLMSRSSKIQSRNSISRNMPAEGGDQRVRLGEQVPVGAGRLGSRPSSAAPAGRPRPGRAGGDADDHAAGRPAACRTRRSRCRRSGRSSARTRSSAPGRWR